MLRKIVFTAGLLCFCLLAQAQSKAKKLTKEEAAGKTQEQRLVHESNRKSKMGKKDISTKKKVKMEQKQDKRARKTRKAKPKKH